MRFLPRLFSRFGVTPREWRVLARLHTGPVPETEILDDAEVLVSFASRGWAIAAADDGTWTLTAEGERIHDRVQRNVRTLRMGGRQPHPRRPPI